MFLSIKNMLDYKKNYYYSNYKNRVGIFPLKPIELLYKNNEEDDIFINTITFSGKKAEELLNFNYKMPSVIKKKIINEVFYNELKRFSFLGKNEAKELKGKLFTHEVKDNGKIISEIKELFFNHNLVDQDVLSFFVKNKNYKEKNAFFINEVSSWLSIYSAKITYDMWVMSFLDEYKKYNKDVLLSNNFIPRLIRSLIDNKITTPIEILNNSLLNEESISFGITTFFMYKENILKDSHFKIDSLNKIAEYISEAKSKSCPFENRDKFHRKGLEIILEEINELRELNNDKKRLLLLNKLKINLVNDSIEKNDVREVVRFFENSELNNEVEILLDLLNDFKNQELSKEDDRYLNEIPVFINQLVVKNIELKEFELENYKIEPLIDEIIDIKLVLIEKYEKLIKNKLDSLKSNSKKVIRKN